MANDLLELKPTMKTWVPHVMVFIVPRQMVFLWRSGPALVRRLRVLRAMVKKLIKHSTCRRRLTGKQVEHTSAHRTYAGSSKRRWKQTFTKGYIEQAFTRTCVREAIHHGGENEPYLQRVDARRAAKGVAAVGKRKREDAAGERPSVRGAAELLEAKKGRTDTSRLALSGAAGGELRALFVTQKCFTAKDSTCISPQCEV
jgi:hypothetical protein